MLRIVASLLMVLSLLLVIRFLTTSPTHAQRSVNPASSWITLPCKFSDVATETPSLDTVNAMFADTYPGLAHFWRTASYNVFSLTHTAASWKTLPSTHAFYNGLAGNETTLKNTLFNDCTAAHDATVDFTLYDGINIVFNKPLGGFNPAEPYTATLDSQTKSFAVMWLPNVYYDAQSTWGQRMLAQRMGEAFGLKHSNNSDGDDKWFENIWDVMSNVTFTPCNKTSLGCLAQLPIAYHRLDTGWLSAIETYTGTQITVQLNYLDALPNNSVSAIIVPIDETRYYTVEARRNSSNVNYDEVLPGTAVIIHEVDPNRIEPAWVKNDANDTGFPSSEMWIVGEIFEDITNNIQIRIHSQNANGFEVIVGNDIQITNTPSRTPTLTPTFTHTPTLDQTQTLTFKTETPTLQPTSDKGVNLIRNGTFETFSEITKFPNDWTVKNSTGDKVKCNKDDKIFANSGSCAFMFKGVAGERGKLIQPLPLDTVTGGDRLRLEAAIMGKKTQNGITVKLKVMYINGSKDSIVVSSGKGTGIYATFFNELVLATQPTKIKLQIRYKEPAGKVFVDDIAVTQFAD